ncbi:hypothetical protein K0M31_013652 [Melipona bicolor]|uniref:Uncharacterized protein n=1 Tax=Melipona bicolor TaxID=60889 RepID=A0AA40FHL9_9HYME|nr:hypothetical protein K0M31_013652 [Melipona bicolor]
MILRVSFHRSRKRDNFAAVETSQTGSGGGSSDGPPRGDLSSRGCEKREDASKAGNGAFTRTNGQTNARYSQQVWRQSLDEPKRVSGPPPWVFATFVTRNRAGLIAERGTKRPEDPWCAWFRSMLEFVWP